MLQFRCYIFHCAHLLASYLFPGIAFSGAALFVWQGWLPKILVEKLYTFAVLKVNVDILKLKNNLFVV